MRELHCEMEAKIYTYISYIYKLQSKNEKKKKNKKIFQMEPNKCYIVVISFCVVVINEYRGKTTHSLARKLVCIYVLSCFQFNSSAFARLHRYECGV